MGKIKSSFTRLSLIVTFGLATLATSSKAESLYVSQNGISAYHISENGSLSRIPGAGLPAGSGVSVGAIDRFGHLLYGFNDQKTKVEAFQITRSGALSYLSSVPTEVGANAIATDPFGQFVFVSNFGTIKGIDNPPNSTVSAYQLGGTGILTPAKGSPFTAGVYPVTTVVDPFGRFVYVGNTGTQALATETISGYRIGQKGVLKPIVGSPFANGESPLDLAVDPFGRFLYSADFYDNAFSVYRIGENGGLKEVPGSPFLVGQSHTVVADPLARFVYVSSYTDRVEGFRVGGNGTLTKLPGSPFQVGSGAMAIDLTGRFFYVAGAPGISAFRISPTGSLTVLPGSPFAAGVPSGAMAISPL